jgi:16S rRNA (uracil1498-N3)-methyltransferase
VNLILFEPEEIERPLPRDDRRAIHLLKVLRRREGDTFDAGLVNGPRGTGTLTAVGGDELKLSFVWGCDSPAPDPITLIVGLPRPQTARDILRDATTLGVAAMHFVLTDRGESSYSHSTLWASGEWRRHLITGAEQAFDTRLPEITHGRTLADVVADLPARAIRVALDHYEATVAFAHLPEGDDATPGPAGQVLAFGPERGWSGRERSVLRSTGFTLAHLGSRVLRTETAVSVAIALMKAGRGAW